MHVGERVTRNGLVHFFGGRIDEGEWCAVGLDEHVDHIQRDGVVIGGRQAPGARKVRIDFDDQQPLGVPPGAEQLVAGPADVQGEVDRALLVGRSRLRHHHAGSEPGDDRPHLPEAPRHELHPVAQRVVEPLRRPEETAAVGHPGLGEDVVQVEAEGTPDLQVLPVGAGPQRGQQAVRDARAESEADPVDRLDQVNGLLHRAHRRHGLHSHIRRRRDHGLHCWQSADRRAIHDFRLYPHGGCVTRMIGTPSSSQTTVLGEWRPPPSVAIFQFRSCLRTGCGLPKPPQIGTSGPAMRHHGDACLSGNSRGRPDGERQTRRGSVRSETAGATEASRGGRISPGCRSTPVRGDLRRQVIPCAARANTRRARRPEEAVRITGAADVHEHPPSRRRLRTTRTRFGAPERAQRAQRGATLPGRPRQRTRRPRPRPCSPVRSATTSPCSSWPRPWASRSQTVPTPRTLRRRQLEFRARDGGQVPVASLDVPWVERSLSRAAKVAAWVRRSMPSWRADSRHSSSRFLRQVHGVSDLAVRIPLGDQIKDPPRLRREPGRPRVHFRAFA